METTLDGLRVELIQGDIANQPDMDAVVNAANADLKTGGGVAGAIHRAAGPGLAEECEPYGPIEPGEAVITSGHSLPNPHVIHCLGPVYGRDEPEDELLANCYRQALELAETHALSSIAFPAISTGAFGYPMPDAARVAFATIKAMAPSLASVDHVRFVLFSPQDLEIHDQLLREATE